VNILLDTHIWLWTALDPSRIRRNLAAQLVNPDNQLWLSSISVWEAMTLFQTGRIKIDLDPDTWIRQSLASGFLLEAPVTNEVAIHSRLIDLPHRDPADRLIAATALVNRFTLATADENLLACGTIRTHPNH
jgi:PIN domain nuclease of toxin-antitoxin system